jgi:hypothetical protein
MRKEKEFSDSYSCFNKAYDHELIFVLLGRDRVAPYCIFFWVVLRWLFGINDWNDGKMKEARSLARDMRYERKLL